MRPRVSLITPSHARTELLLAKLASLAEQRVDLAEVEAVVVDNACPQRVGDAASAKAAAEGWPFRLRVLRSEVQLPAAEARAWAAQEASQALLWWSDDDLLLDPHALAAHWERQSRGWCATIGSTRFEFGAHRSEYRPAFVGPAHLTGANSMLPRAAYLGVAARLPALPKAYGGEEAMVGWALRRAGVPFAAVPTSWTTHLGSLPANLSGDGVRAREAGFNAVAIAAFFPESAWAHGVHPILLAVKRWMVASPLRSIIGRTARGRFELGYLEGALEARRTETVSRWLADAKPQS